MLPPRARIATTAVATTAVLLSATACGQGQEADDGVVTLRFSYFTSEQNPIGQTWKEWMQEVTERTNGEIQFEEYWDGTLLSADSTIEGLAEGRADLAQVTPTFYSGRFPLTAVNELPFGSNNVGAIAAAMPALIEKHEGLRDEWSSQGLKTLAWSVGGPAAIVSTKQISAAADFDGLRIRAIDRGSQALTASGASLVAIEPSDLHGALDRELIDATAGIQFGVIPSLSLEEVGDYVVDAGTGAQTASALVMTEDKWEELSEEHQQVIQAVSAEAPAMYERHNRASEDIACEAVVAAGMELTVLPEDEVQALQDAGQANVLNAWLSEVEEAGHDGDAFYEAHRAVVEEASSQFPDGEESGVARCLADS